MKDKEREEASVLEMLVVIYGLTCTNLHFNIQQVKCS